MRKSHEQRLITKEHIAAHTHLNFMALHSSVLVTNVVESCFKPKLLL